MVLSGAPQTAPPPHWEIRPLTASDMAGCEGLHESVHGYTRTNELRDALATGAPIVVLRDRRVRAPARRAALFRWCLMQGYRAIRPMTLMAIGEYREPQGSYFPSVLY
ncbi:hypothetical protein AYJ54_37090 [Bradyrhizobium centrolobii]|uniref:Uncharacterized protein n=1 Tax=Bradyrhizobium centrolobii TaxID=1505087 RepID=A0A176Y846_9BRAD|nr:hypothetical protein [Bradyrhizobium centrolobii]OAE95911.1 hypothetical protein AYJ54_37090 [Bradyrhizobium centrolobii]